MGRWILRHFAAVYVPLRCSLRVPLTRKEGTWIIWSVLVVGLILCYTSSRTRPHGPSYSQAAGSKSLDARGGCLGRMVGGVKIW